MEQDEERGRETESTVEECVCVCYSGNVSVSPAALCSRAEGRERSGVERSGPLSVPTESHGPNSREGEG